ncbi:MAG: hypothetical protein JJLCMIEE_02719 [Acidimicrobiales bacterium]|nr:hypothetical protein [Acidimicrobiales bacterium]
MGSRAVGLLDVPADVLGDAPGHLEPFDRGGDHLVGVLVGAVVGPPVGSVTEPLEPHSELVTSLGKAIDECSHLAEHAVDVSNVLPPLARPAREQRGSGG